MEVLDFWVPREINSTEEVIPHMDSTPGVDSSNPEITYYGLSVQKNFMPKAKAKSMVKSKWVGVKSPFSRCQGESYRTNTFTKLFIPYYTVHIMLLELKTRIQKSSYAKGTLP
jgi:hypothetical protein